MRSAAARAAAVSGVLAVVLSLPGPTAGASVPAAAEGVVRADDAAGLVAAKVPKGAIRRWVTTLPRGVRAGAALGVLRSGGRHPTLLVSRSVAAGSVAGAARLASALRRRPASSWAGDDAAAARVSRRTFVGAVALFWRSGSSAGRIAIAGPSRATARRFAREVVRTVIGRLRARRALTPWKESQVRRAGKAPTTRDALIGFSIAFGVRVPGIPAPRGQPDRPTDGTLALRHALARLGSMTPAQRRVVQRVLAGLHEAAGGSSARVALQPDWKQSPLYQAKAVDAAFVLGLRLGFGLRLALHVGTSRVLRSDSALAVTEALSATLTTSGAPASCWITVHPPGAATTGVFEREIITHEVFHCFQAQMGNDLGNFYSRSSAALDWMIEGGADWAACSAVANPKPERAFQEWLDTPKTALSDRDYAGVGFFLLLSDDGVDLWPRWPAIAKASEGSGAFASSVGATQDILGRIWAPSLMQEPARGASWDPGPVPCRPTAVSSPPVDDLFIGDGQTVYVSAQSYAARLFAVLSDADVIHTSLPNDDARLSSDKPPLDETQLHDRYYCTDLQTDCSCPVRSSRAGPPPPAINGDGGTIIAVTGGQEGVTGKVEGMTREEYCGVKLGLIVPGRSIGDVYLGQSRKSLLNKVDGLVPIEHGFTTKTANGLLLKGDALIGIVFQIHFGLCSSPALENGGAAVCRQQFPQSTPNQVASVQTSSTGYATKNGLGPGSDAAAVVSAVGPGFCEREDGTPAEEQPWHACNVPAADGGSTSWGFTTTKEGANIVLAVAVYNPKAMPD